MEVEATPTYGLEHLDDATTTLILQLQKRDIEELLHANKGKRRDDQVTDAELAVTAYQQELRERLAIIADRCMSRSLAEAVITDAVVLRESLAEEDVALRDRALACHLAGINAPSAEAEGTKTEHPLSDGVISRLAALYGSGQINEADALENTSHGESPVAAEPIAWAASRAKPARPAALPDAMWTPLLPAMSTYSLRDVKYGRKSISTSMLQTKDSSVVSQTVFEFQPDAHIRAEER